MTKEEYLWRYGLEDPYVVGRTADYYSGKPVEAPKNVPVYLQEAEKRRSQQKATESQPLKKTVYTADRFYRDISNAKAEAQAKPFAKESNLLYRQKITQTDLLNGIRNKELDVVGNRVFRLYKDMATGQVTREVVPIGEIDDKGKVRNTWLAEASAAPMTFMMGLSPISDAVMQFTNSGQELLFRKKARAKKPEEVDKTSLIEDIANASLSELDVPGIARTLATGEPSYSSSRQIEQGEKTLGERNPLAEPAAAIGTVLLPTKALKIAKSLESVKMATKGGIAMAAAFGPKRFAEARKGQGTYLGAAARTGFDYAFGKFGTGIAERIGNKAMTGLSKSADKPLSATAKYIGKQVAGQAGVTAAITPFQFGVDYAEGRKPDIVKEGLTSLGAQIAIATAFELIGVRAPYRAARLGHESAKAKRVVSYVSENIGKYDEDAIVSQLLNEGVVKSKKDVPKAREMIRTIKNLNDLTGVEGYADFEGKKIVWKTWKKPEPEVTAEAATAPPPYTPEGAVAGEPPKEERAYAFKSDETGRVSKDEPSPGQALRNMIQGNKTVTPDETTGGVRVNEYNGDEVAGKKISKFLEDAGILIKEGKGTKSYTSYLSKESNQNMVDFYKHLTGETDFIPTDKAFIEQRMMPKFYEVAKALEDASIKITPDWWTKGFKNRYQDIVSSPETRTNDLQRTLARFDKMAMYEEFKQGLIKDAKTSPQTYKLKNGTEATEQWADNIMAEIFGGAKNNPAENRRRFIYKKEFETMTPEGFYEKFHENLNKKVLEREEGNYRKIEFGEAKTENIPVEGQVPKTEIVKTETAKTEEAPKVPRGTYKAKVEKIKKPKTEIKPEAPPKEEIKAPPEPKKEEVKTEEQPLGARTAESIKKSNPDLYRKAMSSKTADEFINKVAKGDKNVDRKILTEVFNKVNETKTIQKGKGNVKEEIKTEESKAAAAKAGEQGTKEEVKPTGKKFYVNEVDNNFKTTNKFKEVKGEPVTIKNHEDMDLFVHKTKEGYFVNEARSGLGVGQGKTKEAAVKDAASFLKSKEYIDKTIQERIDKFGTSPRYLQKKTRIDTAIKTIPSEVINALSEFKKTKKQVEFNLGKNKVFIYDNSINKTPTSSVSKKGEIYINLDKLSDAPQIAFVTDDAGAEINTYYAILHELEHINKGHPSEAYTDWKKSPYENEAVAKADEWLRKVSSSEEIEGKLNKPSLTIKQEKINGKKEASKSVRGKEKSSEEKRVLSDTPIDELGSVPKKDRPKAVDPDSPADAVNKSMTEREAPVVKTVPIPKGASVSAPKAEKKLQFRAASKIEESIATAGIPELEFRTNKDVTEIRLKNKGSLRDVLIKNRKKLGLSNSDINELLPEKTGVGVDRVEIRHSEKELSDLKAMYKRYKAINTYSKAALNSALQTGLVALAYNQIPEDEEYDYLRAGLLGTLAFKFHPKHAIRYFKGRSVKLHPETLPDMDNNHFNRPNAQKFLAEGKTTEDYLNARNEAKKELVPKYINQTVTYAEPNSPLGKINKGLIHGEDVAGRGAKVEGETVQGASALQQFHKKLQEMRKTNSNAVRASGVLVNHIRTEHNIANQPGITRERLLREGFDEKVLDNLGIHGKLTDEDKAMLSDYVTSKKHAVEILKDVHNNTSTGFKIKDITPLTDAEIGHALEARDVLIEWTKENSRYGETAMLLRKGNIAPEEMEAVRQKVKEHDAEIETRKAELKKLQKDYREATDSEKKLKIEQTLKKAELELDKYNSPEYQNDKLFLRHKDAIFELSEEGVYIDRWTHQSDPDKVKLAVSIQEVGMPREVEVKGVGKVERKYDKIRYTDSQAQVLAGAKDTKELNEIIKLYTKHLNIKPAGEEHPGLFWADAQNRLGMKINTDNLPIEKYGGEQKRVLVRLNKVERNVQAGSFAGFREQALRQIENWQTKLTNYTKTKILETDAVRELNEFESNIRKIVDDMESSKEYGENAYESSEQMTDLYEALHEVLDSVDNIKQGKLNANERFSEFKHIVEILGYKKPTTMRPDRNFHGNFNDSAEDMLNSMIKGLDMNVRKGKASFETGYYMKEIRRQMQELYDWGLDKEGYYGVLSEKLHPVEQVPIESYFGKSVASIIKGVDKFTQTAGRIRSIMLLGANILGGVRNAVFPLVLETPVEAWRAPTGKGLTTFLKSPVYIGTSGYQGARYASGRLLTYAGERLKYSKKGLTNPKVAELAENMIEKSYKLRDVWGDRSDPMSRSSILHEVWDIMQRSNSNVESYNPGYLGTFGDPKKAEKAGLFPYTATDMTTRAMAVMAKAQHLLDNMPYEMFVKNNPHLKGKSPNEIRSDYIYTIYELAKNHSDMLHGKYTMLHKGPLERMLAKTPVLRSALNLLSPSVQLFRLTANMMRDAAKIHTPEGQKAFVAVAGLWATAWVVGGKLAPPILSTITNTVNWAYMLGQGWLWDEMKLDSNVYDYIKRHLYKAGKAMGMDKKTINAYLDFFDIGVLSKATGINFSWDANFLNTESVIVYQLFDRLAKTVAKKSIDASEMFRGIATTVVGSQVKRIWEAYEQLMKGKPMIAGRVIPGREKEGFGLGDALRHAFLGYDVDDFLPGMRAFELSTFPTGVEYYDKGFINELKSRTGIRSEQTKRTISENLWEKAQDIYIGWLEGVEKPEVREGRDSSWDKAKDFIDEYEDVIRKTANYLMGDAKGYGRPSVNTENKLREQIVKKSQLYYTNTECAKVLNKYAEGNYEVTCNFDDKLVPVDMGFISKNENGEYVINENYPKTKLSDHDYKDRGFWLAMEMLAKAANAQEKDKEKFNVYGIEQGVSGDGTDN